MTNDSTSGSDYLSRELEAYIDEVDRGYRAEDDDKNDVDKIEALLRVAISSLEGFAAPYARRLIEVLEECKADWYWHADNFYTREVVANIQAMVNRFAKLSPVLVDVIPSKNVGAYLREASRCFIYGFPQATVALCRVALEAGLTERLEPLTTLVGDMNLFGKIETAAKDDIKLLSPATASLAHDVRRKANEVLHGEPMQQQNFAFEILVQTRGILRELYEK